MLQLVSKLFSGVSIDLPAGVPASWDANPGTARALRTWDFPEVAPDPDDQTHVDPQIDGLYGTATGSTSNSSRKRAARPCSRASA